MNDIMSPEHVRQALSSSFWLGVSFGVSLSAGVAIVFVLGATFAPASRVRAMVRAVLSR